MEKLDTASAVGELTFHIFASLAQFERQLISERTRAGLAAARARGNTVVDGLGMLLHQAAPGFEKWFGVRPAVDDALRQLILADMEKH